VEFSLEEMDTDGIKKGATCNAIRDWIKDKYGYRVTNINIPQVKQKHGILSGRITISLNLRTISNQGVRRKRLRL